MIFKALKLFAAMRCAQKMSTMSSEIRKGSKYLVNMDKDVKGTVSPLSLALLCVGGLATLSNIFKDFKVHLKALLRSRWS